MSSYNSFKSFDILKKKNENPTKDIISLSLIVLRDALKNGHSVEVCINDLKSMFQLFLTSNFATVQNQLECAEIISTAVQHNDKRAKLLNDFKMDQFRGHFCTFYGSDSGLYLAYRELGPTYN